MLLKLLVTILFLIAPALTELSDVDKCVLQFQSQLKNKTTIKALSGITGIGWNDLDNSVTLPIYATTFKQCLSVPDNDFLIPDNVFAIPLKDIDMHQSTETFGSFDEFIKSSSDKVTVEASGSFKGFSAGGSFSYENQETKRDFSKTNTYMLQNRLVYKAYQFIANQHYGLDPLFTERLEEVAKEIKNGKMRVAKYKAQLIINDYGTHVINSATICKDEEVFEDVEDRYLVTAFWCYKKQSEDISKKDDPQDTVKPNKLQRIMSYETLATLEESPTQVALFFREIKFNDNLTALTTEDSGEEKNDDYIDVTPTQLDELLHYPNVLEKLLPFFTIEIPEADRTTTTTERPHVIRVGYFPPTPKPIPMTLLTYFKEYPEQIQELAKNPELLREHLFPKKVEKREKLKHIAFFGGMYEREQNNPFTGAPSCPLNFKPYKFMGELSVCIWVDEVADWPISLGKIFHCNSKEQQCPRGYSQYLGADYDGCALYYCVRMVNRKKFDFPSINRPPYVNLDEVISEIKVELR